MSIALIILALAGIAIVLTKAGGGYVDTATGIGPRSSSALVNQLAQAIAKAEGFNVPGSRPARNHNPGDISDTYLSTGKDGPLSVFPDDQTGWDALTHKLENILSGLSTTFPLTDDFYDFAHTWTGGDQETGWAEHVATAMSVDPASSLNDVVMNNGGLTA